MIRAALTALLLAGCAERPPAPPEPCEVWVNDYARNVSYCISREHLRRDLCKLNGSC